jgi:predicted RNase H-like HicB family nuclease
MPALAEVVHAGSTFRLPVILREGEDGYIVATCPLLPGTTTQGHTREEALANIHEAALLALECAAEEGWSPPASYSVELVEVAV